MEFWIMAVLVIIFAIVAGFVIMALANNWMLAVIAGLIIFIVWGYTEYMKLKGAHPPSPYELVKKDFQSQALKCKPRTPGCLNLSIDGLYHFTKLGRILGFFDWTPYVSMIKLSERGKSKRAQMPNDLDDAKISIAKTFKDKTKGWSKLLVVAYKERDSWFWNLPLINLLNPVTLFLAPEHQVWRGAQKGDINIRGTTPRPVYFFRMADSPDLNPEYIGLCINGETDIRINEYILDQATENISRAMKADPSHEKMIDLLTRKPGSGHGIS
jgi:hypothetical protein